jgi:hypothetical protein
MGEAEGGVCDWRRQDEEIVAFRGELAAASWLRAPSRCRHSARKITGAIAYICFLFAVDLLCLQAARMQIFAWDDRRNPSQPRAVIQSGRCDEGQCGQFSISISNGERGMTVRFDSEDEFKIFLQRGAAEKR